MSMTVVTPPAAAAAVSEPKSSLSGKPGSRLCTCTSMAPGSTYIPSTSTTRASREAADFSMLVITPSAICTSVTRGPSGVKTVPPRRMRSVKRQVGNAKQRRVRQSRLRDVVLPALTAIQHDHQPDHLESRGPQHLHGAQGVAAGGDHVLDDGHALANFEPALDLLCGAVAFRLLPHQHERQPHLDRNRAAKQHGPELGGGEQLRVSGHQLGKVASEAA